MICENMFILNYIKYWWGTRRFKDYQPKRVSTKATIDWLKQFPKQDRKWLYILFSQIRYFNQEETKNYLLTLNQQLIERLRTGGLTNEKIIYITIDETGSSSHVMLNMLKEAALLERKKFKFLDSKDIRGISDTTASISQGAIIFIDDFIGSGTQFCRSRDYAMNFAGTDTFSEFLLAPCICEEALIELDDRGIEPITSLIHRKLERPLHPECNILEIKVKKRLLALCDQVAPGAGLGFMQLATSVVFYRNTPNSVPLVLRGNIGQNKFVGIIPRTTDLG